MGHTEVLMQNPIQKCSTLTHESTSIHHLPFALSLNSFHFSSLAHDNDATSSQVLSVEAASTSNNNNNDSRTPAPTILKGTQTVRKFNKDDAPLDVVLIHVAVWRLAPTKDVDLVMSWNEPVAQAGAGGQESQTSTAAAAAVTGGPGTGDHKVATAFERAARTLSIADWGLFA